MDDYQLSVGVKGIKELAHCFATPCHLNFIQRRNITEALYCLKKKLIHQRREKKTPIQQDKKDPQLIGEIHKD